MMNTPDLTGRSAPSQPIPGQSAPSQPLGGPPPRPLGGPPSRPLGGAMSGPLGGTTSRSLVGSPSRPAHGPATQRRLQLSEAIEHRIEVAAARDRQRIWLVNTVVLAQTLVTLALVPAYLMPDLSAPMLATLGAALLVYIATFIINRTPGKQSSAIYTLVIGGGLVTVAQVFLGAALTQSGAHTAQASLFFIPVIIEAGLFLSPELTLIVAAVAAALTASAILLALALAGNSSAELGDAYQVVVYALGVQALVGYMSWQLATFIYEKVTAAQTSEDLRFAQARLEAFERQMAEQRRQLQREAGLIQAAVSSLLSHEYDTRVEIEDGELAPLAHSLNLLFERLRSTNEMERQMQRMQSAVPSLVDYAGRMADPNAPAQQSEVVSSTALLPVGVALSNAHSAQARRLAQLFQLASDVADTLRENQRLLSGAAADSVAAQRQTGELVALADAMTRVAQREVELITQSRRLLAHLLPRELTEGAWTDERDPLLDAASNTTAATGDLGGLGADIGLGATGLTSEFNALPPADAQAAGIAPLTMPMPAMDAETGEQEVARPAFAPGELPGELVDSWGLLRQLHAAVAQEQRHAAILARDMGMLSRLVRQTDMNLVKALRTLDAAQKQAEQAQALSGGTSDDQAGEGMGQQAPTTAPHRAPLATRPLDADARLGDSGRWGSPDAPGSAAPAPGSLRVSDLLDTAGDQMSWPPDRTPPDVSDSPE
jgi:hypothetical protein